MAKQNQYAPVLKTEPTQRIGKMAELEPEGCQPTFPAASMKTGHRNPQRLQQW